MKDTKQTMTLRGNVQITEGADYELHNIFEYANVLDIGKGWKIDGYRVWIQDYRLGTQSNDTSTCSVETFLSTDVNIQSTMLGNCQDNRQIAWGNYTMGLGSADKVQITKVQGCRDEFIWIDPDHLVQDQLNLWTRFGASSVIEGQTRRLNYIVYMRQFDITPSESIIQNIKSKAQDLQL